MNLELAAVAETLANEFPHVRSGLVVHELCECLEEFPNGGPHFIEQAARARLASHVRPPRGRSPRGRSPKPERCALNVSLHDSALAHEMELTTSLMIAANEVDGALRQEEIDRILGVVAPARWVIPVQPVPAHERLEPSRVGA